MSLLSARVTFLYLSVRGLRQGAGRVQPAALLQSMFSQHGAIRTRVRSTRGRLLGGQESSYGPHAYTLYNVGKTARLVVRRCLPWLDVAQLTHFELRLCRSCLVQRGASPSAAQCTHHVFIVSIRCFCRHLSENLVQAGSLVRRSTRRSKPL